MADKQVYNNGTGIKGQLMTASENFWRLLEESIIVQSIVTLLAVGVTAWCVMAARPLANEWWTLLGIIIGFWFGAKATIGEKNARRDEQKMALEVMRAMAGKPTEDC